MLHPSRRPCGYARSQPEIIARIGGGMEEQWRQRTAGGWDERRRLKDSEN